jgi:hypothetical protein
MNLQSDITKIVPVIISILVIISVAILRNYSRNVAAIAAVMPLNIPLAMYVIYSGAEDKQKALLEFNEALFLNMAPFVIFMLVTWQGAKAGWGLAPILIAGYVSWAGALAAAFALRALLR